MDASESAISDGHLRANVFVRLAETVGDFKARGITTIVMGSSAPGKKLTINRNLNLKLPLISIPFRSWLSFGSLFYTS